MTATPPLRDEYETTAEEMHDCFIGVDVGELGRVKVVIA